VLALGVAAESFAKDQGPATYLYSGLSEHQKTLFRAYVDSRVGQPSGRAESFYQDYWKNTLNTGEPTVFAAVTHALEHTQLSNGETALDEVDQITVISGDIPQNPSYEQFNLKLTWKDGAYWDFWRAGFTYRIGHGHEGETGLSLLSSSQGLHLLFAKDATTNGHAHVDYRAIGLGDILGAGEGHLTPYNADVRAIGPERDGLGTPINNHDRHVQWYGDLPGYVRNE
jgi:hypothetical protein